MTESARDRLTSVHLKRAIDSDRESIAWIVARFTPLLLFQARQRLPPSLRRLYDADDILADVWITVLSALPRLVPSEGSRSLGFLRYASTVLIRHIRDLLEKHVIGKPRVTPISASDSSIGIPASVLPDDARGVISQVIAEERKGEVWNTLSGMDAKDREIVILCGIEGRAHKDVGALLDTSAENVALRYHRALKRLKERMPDSVFADFED